MKQMILALLAAGVAWGVDAAVVYRGRLADMRDPQQTLTFGGTKTMTFKFYNDDGVEQPGLDFTQEVPLEADGSFTAHLDSQGLTAAIQAGTATQVGLTIGRAAKEIQPRRKLLPTARAAQAVTAGGLSRGATVGTLTTETLEANQVSARGDLTVGGAIVPSVGGQRFNQTPGYAVKMSDQGGRLALEGYTKVFGDVAFLGEKQGCKAGDFLCNAPADGVAVIGCSGPVFYSTPSVLCHGEGPYCSIVQFCHQGDAIKVPDDWYFEPAGIDSEKSEDSKKKTFRVHFYKFLD